ncbi:MAG: GHKL domain-containing protein [Chitinophagaceae bacterium]|nr:GHKL domain-containing protein [Chitinophagaceae bacterium]
MLLFTGDWKNMAFKQFSIGLVIRITIIVMLALFLTLCVYQSAEHHFASAVWWIISIISALFLLSAGINLYHYTNSINRKLNLFFDSIRYDDFSIRFTNDNALGKSFTELNRQFLQVQEAFKVLRAENEASLYLMKTLITNIQTGMIVFDQFGRIEMINNAACDILGYRRIKNINDLKHTHSGLFEMLLENSRNSTHFLYCTPSNKELSMNVLRLVIREQEKTLLTFHNISEVLQRKEVEAWQNLTRVLRHEIMNSLTPILSLIGTMKHIVTYEIKDKNKSKQAWIDLLEALGTIETRGKGMISFVEGYRHFANIPSPKTSTIKIQNFIFHVKALLQTEIEAAGILLTCETPAEPIYIKADPDQLSMVMINIVKNAREALSKTTNPEIKINISKYNDQVLLEIRDNGTGIEPDALNDIFIPFYSTKKEGVGIGLSLSRQIVQHHGGILKAESELMKGSKFIILLNTAMPPELSETTNSK